MWVGTVCVCFGCAHMYVCLFVSIGEGRMMVGRRMTEWINAIQTLHKDNQGVNAVVSGYIVYGRCVELYVCNQFAEPNWKLIIKLLIGTQPLLHSTQSIQPHRHTLPYRKMFVCLAKCVAIAIRATHICIYTLTSFCFLETRLEWTHFREFRGFLCIVYKVCIYICLCGSSLRVWVVNLKMAPSDSCLFATFYHQANRTCVILHCVWVHDFFFSITQFEKEIEKYWWAICFCECFCCWNFIKILDVIYMWIMFWILYIVYLNHF